MAQSGRRRKGGGILLAVDTAVGEAALTYAGAIATALNLPLDLWMIVETVDEVRSALPLLQERLSILQGVTPDVGGQVKRGLAADIMRNINGSDYELAMLSFTGRRGLKKIFPRAEVVSILHHARVNYLVHWGRKKELKRILFCTGGSPYGQQAVEFGARIATQLQAEATLLYVAETEPSLFLRRAPEPEEIEDPNLKRALDEALLTLKNEGVEAELTVRHGKVANQILAEASPGKHDLVVLGSHGMGGIRSFILGSVSEEVVKRARVPVLIVRAQERRKFWHRFLGLK